MRGMFMLLDGGLPVIVIPMGDPNALVRKSLLRLWRTQPSPRFVGRWS